MCKRGESTLTFFFFDQLFAQSFGSRRSFGYQWALQTKVFVVGGIRCLRNSK